MENILSFTLTNGKKREFKGEFRVKKDTVELYMDGFGFAGQLIHLDVSEGRPVMGIFEAGPNDADGPTKVVSFDLTKEATEEEDMDVTTKIIVRAAFEADAIKEARSLGANLITPRPLSSSDWDAFPSNDIGEADDYLVLVIESQGPIVAKNEKTTTFLHYF